jgi:hypothetical protein
MFLDEPKPPSFIITLPRCPKVDMDEELEQVSDLLDRATKVMDQDQYLFFDRTDAKIDQQLTQVSFEELEKEFGDPFTVTYPEFETTQVTKNIIDHFRERDTTLDTTLKTTYMKNPATRTACRSVRRVYFKKLRCQKYMIDAANKKMAWLESVRADRNANQT